MLEIQPPGSAVVVLRHARVVFAVVAGAIPGHTASKPAKGACQLTLSSMSNLKQLKRL